MRRLTVIEWLTLIAVVAILLGFLLIPDNHTLNRRNLEQRASNWKDGPPAELSDPSILSTNTTLEGTWTCQHRLDHSRFTFTRQRNGQFVADFSTGGCLGGCDLRRKAVLDAGVVHLDQAVAEYFPRTYDTLYAIHIDGVDYLLPEESVRDFEQEFGSKDGMWHSYLYCRQDALNTAGGSRR